MVIRICYVLINLYCIYDELSTCHYLRNAYKCDFIMKLLEVIMLSVVFITLSYFINLSKETKVNLTLSPEEKSLDVFKTVFF